jgi:hypothetical protein
MQHFWELVVFPDQEVYSTAVAYISQPKGTRFVVIFPLAVPWYPGVRRASLCACKSGSPTIAGLIRYTLLPFNQSPRASVEPGTADTILSDRVHTQGYMYTHTHTHS